jgi:Domain of unknown function (DUF4412)
MHKLLLVPPIFFIAPILFVAVACSNNNAAANGAGGASPGSASADAVSGSGDDMYYEYTIASSRKGINVSGYTKLYVSSGGDLRSEMDMSNPAADKSAPIVSIGNKDKPGQSIMIDDSAKTYTVNTIDTSTSPSSNDVFKLSSTVTKVGEEKIRGFNCVHARVITTRSMGPMGKLTDTVELWNSPDVPLATFFRHYMDKNFSKSWTTMMSPEAADQLKQMGFTGFMVKIQSGSGSSGMDMELTKVQKADFPKSMFEIPAGYKEEKQ